MNGAPSHPDEQTEADANWLRQGESVETRSSGDSAVPNPPAVDEGYDVLAPETPGADPANSIPAPSRWPAAEREATDSVPSRSGRPSDVSVGSDPRVDRVWSRWGEWWPSLVILAAVAAGTLGLAYVSFDPENLSTSLLIVLVGGLLGLVLSYPMVITLERPVRVTPEQAVRDYFGALCHHLPHYRRMWLLLSSEGRICGEYGSYEGFKAYWKRRLSELRSGRASGWTPLVVLIQDFDSEKSVGRSTIDVTFRVDVFARGRRGEAPLAAIPLALTLVRGPDRMWYLNRGTLPQVDR